MDDSTWSDPEWKYASGTTPYWVASSSWLKGSFNRRRSKNAILRGPNAEIPAYQNSNCAIVRKRKSFVDSCELGGLTSKAEQRRRRGSWEESETLCDVTVTELRFAPGRAYILELFPRK
jgi:hypothetical protein